MTNLLAGVCLAVLGGVLTGSFTAPMKFTHRWTWENNWFVYSIVGLLIIPIAMASLSVPHLLEVYHAANPRAVVLAVLFGFGWGVGSVLFGLGITMLGMALGFAIILGLTAAAGCFIPLIVLSPEALATARGAAVVLGLAIVVCGIVVCAKAGGLKNQSEGSTLDRQHYRKGLLICISSGLFNAMLNLALAFGAPVAEAAMRGGATPFGAQNAIWALAVGGGSVANICYTLFLLFRNHSWRQFVIGWSARSAVLASAMGVLWMTGVSVYGAGATALGSLGPVMGWPLFMSMVIITGNVWGYTTGEWKRAPPVALRTNLFGVAILILAIVVISIGSIL